MPDIDTSKAINRVYRPYPTMIDFHKSDDQFRGVVGGTGTGKSIAMIAECMKRGREQEPDQNGWRRTRGAVVRQSYPSLLQTTIKSWKEWVPQGHMVMSPPLRWTWKQEKFLSDGTGIDMDVIFLSVKDPRADIGKLRSLDLTWLWVNEAQEIRDRLLIEWMMNRVGRFPDPQTAPLTWSGLFADANAMPTKHWWYQWAEVLRPNGYKFFRQPACLLTCEKGTPDSAEDACGVFWKINPLCENIRGQAKGAKYWLDQVSGKHTSWIKVNLCGEYGQSLDGKPVYHEFEQERHIAKVDLEPIQGLPLQLGFDWGLNTSCAICQITPQGQLRVIDELSSIKGTRQFVRDDLKPLLASRYAGFSVLAWGEPSGNIRSQIDDQATCMSEVRAQGIDIKASPTNNPKACREAVASFMLKRVTSFVTGERSAEGFIVSPRCTMLLEGFRGEYKYKSVQTSAGAMYKDEIDECGMDHLQDALSSVAVAYDRPRIEQSVINRMGNPNGTKLTIGYSSDYPQI